MRAEIDKDNSDTTSGTSKTPFSNRESSNKRSYQWEIVSIENPRMGYQEMGYPLIGCRF